MISSRLMLAFAASILVSTSLDARTKTVKNRSQNAPLRKLNLQIDKQTKEKLVASLEKERALLLNRYKKRELHTQALREQNKSLAASVSNLETELATAAVRKQALQA